MRSCRSGRNYFSAYVFFTRWFKKDASAFEVASLASKQPVSYAKFRADHIDKFSKIEILLIGAVTLAIFALILVFV